MSAKITIRTPISPRDRVLAHYGFTDEELDFIINYDIKYRMGPRRGSYGRGLKRMISLLSGIVEDMISCTMILGKRVRRQR